MHSVPKNIYRLPKRSFVQPEIKAVEMAKHGWVGHILREIIAYARREGLVVTERELSAALAILEAEIGHDQTSKIVQLNADSVEDRDKVKRDRK